MAITTTPIVINNTFDKIEIRKLIFIDGIAYITFGYYRADLVTETKTTTVTTVNEKTLEIEEKEITETIEKSVETKAPNDFNKEINFNISDKLAELSDEDRLIFSGFVSLILNIVK